MERFRMFISCTSVPLRLIHETTHHTAAIVLQVDAVVLLSWTSMHSDSVIVSQHNVIS
jgi:hypothetical protein